MSELKFRERSWHCCRPSGSAECVLSLSHRHVGKRLDLLGDFLAVPGTRSEPEPMMPVHCGSARMMMKSGRTSDLVVFQSGCKVLDLRCPTRLHALALVHTRTNPTIQSKQRQKRTTKGRG
eukprot:1671617-Rhodomonas_salina.3